MAELFVSCDCVQGNIGEKGHNGTDGSPGPVGEKGIDGRMGPPGPPVSEISICVLPTLQLRSFYFLCVSMDFSFNMHQF